ncbi:hypothetical protein NAEGRDRAFT_79215 [Naegleria gruberi]|uniref:Uncharacterized protein n=1 Tax=Naegleria gruberi TaxID=5762 RepID=D2VAH3_NAEGR|nr:uncharacterized protein NAEGRDRAFT_79215 [Naegleria gruberi]EFC46073.1 hypothetical protein NAEGRDRAFT_79215 [Naegleria gruberi]|eukprot:XP_002678817.1 hypothetical protein NAEGRDRAFT_79215 [Naegleria gruberi strain NEG-M]
MLKTIKRISSSSLVQHHTNKTCIPYVTLQKACYAKAGERKHKEQMTDVRKQYKQFYTTSKEQQDEKSRKEFASHRERVLIYRKHKRANAIQNMQMHERMMQIEKEEHDRERKERAQRAINWESIQQSKRRDSLRRLASEAEYFISPENIDRHIENQLNPARVVVPTVFGSGKYGINDEVALEHLKNTKDRMILRKESVGEDPLYPNSKVYADHMAYLNVRVGTQSGQLFDSYEYINEPEGLLKMNAEKEQQGIEESFSSTGEEDEFEAIDMASLELEDINVDDKEDLSFRPLTNIENIEKLFESASANLKEGFDTTAADKLILELSSIEDLPASDLDNMGNEEVSWFKDLDRTEVEDEQNEREEEEESDEVEKEMDQKLMNAAEAGDVEYAIDRAIMDKHNDGLMASVEHIQPILKDEVQKAKLIKELSKTQQLAQAHVLHPMKRKNRRVSNDSTTKSD